MKTGDTMVRVRGSRVRTVTIRTVGRKWITTDDGERYHVGTLQHEQHWGRLYTPEQHEAEQAERDVREKLRALLALSGRARVVRDVYGSGAQAHCRAGGEVMSRIGIWIQFGKAESAQDAAARIGSKTGFVGEVIRLKDKNSTGPSVAQRLAELEAKFRDATGVIFEAIGKHDQSRAAAERRFLAIEAEHAALVERIGDLEREPVASPPATTEPTPSGAAEDRLAKVATDDDLLDLFERAECASCDTRAARRALYNLGREHGRAERDALLARAEKAERELADHRAARTAAQERADVVAMLDDQEAYARKYDQRVADAYLHARVRVANGEHIGAAKATTSEPTDAEMAAELREAGWLDCTTGWADTHGDAAGLSLDQAYAAMRAAKGAK